MKKISLLWLLCLGTLGLMAQEADTLMEAPAETAPSTLVRAFSAPVDRYLTDEKINDGFALFGDPLTSFIFYAPKIGEDVLIGIKGNLDPKKDFFDQPPFTVTYNYPEDEPVQFGKTYLLSRGADDRLYLIFDTKTTVPIGEEVELEGVTFSVENETAKFDPKADALRLNVTAEGDEAMVESFRFNTQPVETGAGAETIKDVVLTYQRRLPVGPNGLVRADGYTFRIQPNAGSAYALDPGVAYTFKVTEIYFLPIVILVLLLGATYFTFYFKFVNFRRFKLAIDVVRGKYSDPEEKGEVSHFQALTAALSGTVGLGNIAGVAIAISIGGAGATFWMILAGLLGMSSKFTECTLGVRYRTIDAKGEVSGGPMYYLSRGLAERGLPNLGKFFAIFFAIMCIGGSFGGGNMFQVNQAFKQFANLSFVENTWIADNGWMFGVFMALLVAIVIIGGIRSIAKVTDKIVPFMCGVYVLAALVIIGMNLGEVPRVFGEILSGAFSPTAVAGGFVGVLIQGFRRGAFSNEAGVGSASIAHAAVKTNNPASEGIVALLEPFIDTVIVCTMTAIVIIITNNHLDPGAADGVQLTSAAFSAEIPFFKYVLAVAVILFAFSTMITWSYYGLKAWTYLFGGSRAADVTYKVTFCVFVVVGAAASLSSVTDFSDAMIFAMAFPNIIGLTLLAPEVRTELNRYIGKIKSGAIIRVK